MVNNQSDVACDQAFRPHTRLKGYSSQEHICKMRALELFEVIDPDVRLHRQSLSLQVMNISAQVYLNIFKHASHKNSRNKF
jgi:hypothetical protein